MLPVRPPGPSPPGQSVGRSVGSRRLKPPYGIQRLGEERRRWEIFSDASKRFYKQHEAATVCKSPSSTDKMTATVTQLFSAYDATPWHTFRVGLNYSDNAECCPPLLPRGKLSDCRKQISCLAYMAANDGLKCHCILNKYVVEPLHKIKCPI